MRKPQPSKRQQCFPLHYLMLRQVNRRINLKARGKLSIFTSLILAKRVRGNNQGYHHGNANPQAANAVGQARVKTGLTLRYETYMHLNATCATIYLSIAYLIPKSKPKQPDYKSMKNTGMFCCDHEYNSHDGKKCITLRNLIEILAREGKIDQFLIHPPRDTIANAK
ncbi:hypothetical protein ACFX1Z_024134 [Malus domestica]